MIDLEKIKTTHFIGIKGVGMSALAIIMKEMGYEVTGSDVEEKFITDKNLEKAGIPVTIFDSKNLEFNPDLVVIAPSWGADNSEVQAVEKLGLEKIDSAILMGLVMDQKKGIAITGTHGKTTTSGMMAYVLKALDLDPSYFIGTGNIFGFEGNGHWGQGDYFVMEGDEYKISDKDLRPKFLALRPKIALVTSIEMDHPDFFKDLAEVQNYFKKFTHNIYPDGYIVACGDYKAVRETLAEAKQRIEYYGFEEENDWVARDLIWHEESTDFTVLYKGMNLGKFTTQLAGKHSVLNALGVIAICNYLKLDLEKVKKALDEFIGTERRLETKGYWRGAMIIDDYAHHPTAIKITLKGLRDRFPNKKIWCVFQPHTFSRTKLMLRDFAEAFDGADHAFISEIWSSAREQGGDVSSQDIVDIGSQNHPDMRYFPDLEEAKKTLLQEVEGEGNIVVTMGAGDVYHLAEELINDK